MTLNTGYKSNKHIGNGVTKDFTYDFESVYKESISVYLRINDVMVKQDSGFEFTWSTEGGTVTFATAPISGQEVVISRETEDSQEVALKTSQGFQASVIESSFDKITAIAQELQESVKLCVTLDKGVDSSLYSLTLPRPNEGKTLVWNSIGGFVNSTIDVNAVYEQCKTEADKSKVNADQTASDRVYVQSNIESAVASAKITTADKLAVSQYRQEIDDIATEVEENRGQAQAAANAASSDADATSADRVVVEASEGRVASYEASARQSAQTASNAAGIATSSSELAVKAANGTLAEYAEGSAKYYSEQSSESASNASISESNASTSASNAAISETNAATSAGNALSSENKAATSEGNAATSAANALASEGKAKTSETNAATSESNASTSAGNASTSAGNAKTSEDNAKSEADRAQRIADQIGTPLTFKGRVDTKEDLPPTGNKTGDFYLVGLLSSSNKAEYVWLDTFWEVFGFSSDFVQMQSDLEETNSSSPAFIKNKEGHFPETAINLLTENISAYRYGDHKGFYWQPNNSYATLERGYPFANEGGSLEILPAGMYAGKEYATQRFTSLVSQKTAVRTCGVVGNVEVWSDWKIVQDQLISGTNIKTLNNQSLLGSGDIAIQGWSPNTASAEDKATVNSWRDLDYDNAVPIAKTGVDLIYTASKRGVVKGRLSCSANHYITSATLDGVDISNYIITGKESAAFKSWYSVEMEAGDELNLQATTGSAIGVSVQFYPFKGEV